MGLPLQNPAIRPTFDTIKLALADIANETFKCSLESASQMKRTRQQALLSQMLPSKVHVLKPILAPLINKSADMHNYKLVRCAQSQQSFVCSFCACQSRRHAVLCALTCCINVPVLELQCARHDHSSTPLCTMQVLAALRDGRSIEPEQYDCVTVIFCDIMDFNELAAALQPQQVQH